MSQYQTVEDWTAAMYRALDMGAQLITDETQLGHLYGMRRELASIVNRTQIPAGTWVQCTSCGAPIKWALTATGARCPYDVNEAGQKTDVSHFRTCPNAKQHSKKARQ